MGLMRSLPENYGISCDVLPQDTNGQAQGGNYIFTSLRNNQEATALILVGAHSGSAAAITLRQAKNVEGNGSKALGFTNYWEMKPTASPPETADRWDAKVAVSNTFNIAANTIFAIPVKQAMLDVTNDFDCVRIQLAAPDAATLVSMFWLLGAGPEAVAGIVGLRPSARVNRMPN